MFDLINFEKEIKDERQMKALLWIGSEEFRVLWDLFWEMNKKIKEEEYNERKKIDSKSRRSSGWNPSKLNDNKKKSFFCYTI